MSDRTTVTAHVLTPVTVKPCGSKKAMGEEDAALLSNGDGSAQTLAEGGTVRSYSVFAGEAIVVQYHFRVRHDVEHPGQITSPASKVVSLEVASDIMSQARAEGRTFAQCHGCFDLVHPGHIRHLKQAAEQADKLLVSITPDESVDKGLGRPLFSEQLRAENLAALSFVDYVCVNTSPTAEELLERLRPDVFVKGQEYETNADPRFANERRAVESYGGRIVFTSGDLVFSSSALIRQIEHGEAEAIETDPRCTALHRLRSMHDLSATTLDQTLKVMQGMKVVVIGEVITDTYISCDHPEVSSESPCLSLRPIDQISFDGGAAVIALHAAALGADVTLVTALPETDSSRSLIKRLEGAGVRVKAIHCDEPMLEKQRFLVGCEKVVKLDRVRPLTLDTDARNSLLTAVREECAGGVAAALVADFGNGLLTSHSLDQISEAIRPHARVLAGDISGRRSSLLSLRSMDLVTPTEIELRTAVGDYDSSLNAVVWKLMEQTGAQAVTTTLADSGLIMFTRLSGVDEPGWRARVAGEHIPSLEPRPLDTLGCGDAFLAVSTLSLAAGATHVQSAYLGAVAAAAESTKLGNTPVNLQEITSRLRALAQSYVKVHTRPLRAGETSIPVHAPYA